MQLQLDEVVALTPGHGASQGATMLLVGMPAHRASAEFHGDQVGSASAHRTVSYLDTE